MHVLPRGGHLRVTCRSILRQGSRLLICKVVLDHLIVLILKKLEMIAGFTGLKQPRLFSIWEHIVASLSWSTLKENLDRLIPFWSKSQMLIWTTWKWLSFVYQFLFLIHKAVGSWSSWANVLAYKSLYNELAMCCLCSTVLLIISVILGLVFGPGMWDSLIWTFDN